MIEGSSLLKMWALLDRQERRNAFKVLVVMIFGAFGSALMVGSIFPFLSVLADPDLIEEVSALSWAYVAGGFTSDYRFLVALGLCAVAVIVLANLLQILATWATVRFAQMRIHSISRRLLAHYLSQPYDFFLSRHSADMSAKILTECQQVVGGYLLPLAYLISAGLTVAAVIATLILLDPVVAIATITCFGTVYGIVMVVTRHYVKALGQRRAEANQARYRVSGEALGGIKDVKLLGREGAYLDRYAGPSITMARTVVNLNILGQVPRYVIQMVAFGGLIFLCLALIDPAGLQDREALGGLLPVIGVLAFAGQRLMPELQKLYSSLTQMTAGAAALDRVHADLVTGTELLFPRQVPPPLGLKDALVLEDISYTYPNAERPGVSGVSLTIQAGERIGIVGSSGAGKTTLVDIILGLLIPNSGNLRADGTEITSDTLRAWQQSVGYVPQSIFLIDASLSENIAFGLRPEEINAARVEYCASVARLHDFAMTELPDGYATRIGERGVRLSGGQRQRIGIARALYHDADVIVFDEATSALDNLTEREVMTAIEALPGEKTILIIAHRLTTVKACNRIVVMEAGSVAGVGTWTALERTNAAFRGIAELADVA